MIWRSYTVEQSIIINSYNSIQGEIIMNKLKRMTPYVLTCTIFFYLLPLIGNSTGSFMVILLVIIPFVCFLTSFIYALNHGWDIILSITIGILFVPSIFIYYNSSAWIYIVIYSAISSLGLFIGKTIKQFR